MRVKIGQGRSERYSRIGRRGKCIAVGTVVVTKRMEEEGVMLEAATNTIHQSSIPHIPIHPIISSTIRRQEFSTFLALFPLSLSLYSFSSLFQVFLQFLGLNWTSKTGPGSIIGQGSKIKKESRNKKKLKEPQNNIC